MAIGLITSPATWLLGTVAAPTWFQQVQDNVNAWLSYNNQSLGAQSTATSSSVPLGRFADAAGNIRFLVDHNGQAMGRSLVFDENWGYSVGTINASASPVTAAQKWNAVITNGGTITISSPTSAYSHPFVNLNCTTTVGSEAYLATTVPMLHSGSTYISAVMEGEVAISTHTGGVYYIGFSDGSSLPSTGVYLYSDSTLTNWQCATYQTTVQTLADAGVAVSTNATPNFRYRIELHGSASPYAALTARLFVNEVLTSQTSGIGSAALQLVFGVRSSVATAATMRVGPMRMVCNRMLAPPSL